MARHATTVYLDDETLQAARAIAARDDRDASDVIEDAVRRYVGLDVVEAVWARSDRGEDEAIALADEEKHAARR
jgi:predicted transcriptional regulator